MKVWITKYALTQGIIEAEADESKASPSMIICHRSGYFENIPFPYFHGEGKEWHKTELEARARANEMVQKKLKSLDKQRKALLSLTF